MTDYAYVHLRATLLDTAVRVHDSATRDSVEPAAVASDLVGCRVHEPTAEEMACATVCYHNSEEVVDCEVGYEMSDDVVRLEFNLLQHDQEAAVPSVLLFSVAFTPKQAEVLLEVLRTTVRLSRLAATR